MSAFDRVELHVELVHETDRAILVRARGHEEWVPRRTIVEFGPVETGGHRLVISRAVALEKGLLTTRFDALPSEGWYIGEAKIPVYVGLQPIAGDLRGHYVEVWLGEEQIAAGLVTAVGGFGRSGDHIRLHEKVGITLR